MKRKMFKCEPVDADFFESAPVRLRKTFEIARPASEVWDSLVADNPLSWCRIIGQKGITWTSPRPFGVGTTRTVRALKGVNVFNEHFFLWDEGKRMAFYVLEASGPLVKRFAEDYIVEPTGEGSCNFTWTIAYEPSAIGRAGEPINKRLLGTLFADTGKHFA